MSKTSFKPSVVHRETPNPYIYDPELKFGDDGFDVARRAMIEAVSCLNNISRLASMSSAAIAESLSAGVLSMSTLDAVDHSKRAIELQLDLINKALSISRKAINS